MEIESRKITAVVMGIPVTVYLSGNTLVLQVHMETERASESTLPFLDQYHM
jgi:hypothetical protein